MAGDEMEFKSGGWLMQVQTLLVGVTTVILTAGIPWAYYVGNKISVMEYSLQTVVSYSREAKADNAQSHAEVTQTVRDHERRISGLETELQIIKQLAEGSRNRPQQGK